MTGIDKVWLISNYCISYLKKKKKIRCAYAWKQSRRNDPEFNNLMWKEQAEKSSKICNFSTIPGCSLWSMGWEMLKSQCHNHSTNSYEWRSSEWPRWNFFSFSWGREGFAFSPSLPIVKKYCSVIFFGKNILTNAIK